jgi:hypothetical protein
LLLKAGFRDVTLFYNDMSTIPKDSYWRGEQDKGYVVAHAFKRSSDAVYIHKFSDLGVCKCT